MVTAKGYVLYTFSLHETFLRPWRAIEMSDLCKDGCQNTQASPVKVEMQSDLQVWNKRRLRTYHEIRQLLDH